MIARLLPPDEWPKLAGTELETVWPHLDKAKAKIVVVEHEDGTILACWSLFPIWHVEGVFVHPGHRGRGRVAKRLVDYMGAVCQHEGITHVVTGCISDQVRELLEHFNAVEIPGQQFTIPVSALTGET